MSDLRTVTVGQAAAVTVPAMQMVGRVITVRFAWSPLPRTMEQLRRAVEAVSLMAEMERVSGWG
ncbi:hypothetical protein ACF05T_31970 [Streptomyces lateritius]|uniref:IclR-ED domain-containing protein n=1 Tax=Streptomyces lateritius TaxID=67313 RepID=A0ABW6YLA4_9ACTN